jgi:hypothetical protein
VSGTQKASRLIASIMWGPASSCGFESRALRFSKPLEINGFVARAATGRHCGRPIWARPRCGLLQIDARRCESSRTVVGTFPEHLGSTLGTSRGRKPLAKPLQPHRSK